MIDKHKSTEKASIPLDLGMLIVSTDFSSLIMKFRST